MNDEWFWVGLIFTVPVILYAFIEMISLASGKERKASASYYQKERRKNRGKT